MPSYVFAFLMCGAALHATWNALIRGAGDRIVTTIAVSGGAAVVAACVLPFLAQPLPASWPFLASSMVVHVVSYSLTARAYHEADMTQIYPLMRGTAPLLTALVAIIWLRDPVPFPAWVGIAIISLGVSSLVLARHRGWSVRGLAVALTNAVAIAGYSAIDGAGVRASHAPAGYALWVFLLTGTVMVGWNLLVGGRQFAQRVVQTFWRGLLGGASSALSYGIALWAMTRVPIAVVSAARECSIAFGTIIAIVFLGERINVSRAVATGLIVVGAVVLRLS